MFKNNQNKQERMILSVRTKAASGSFLLPILLFHKTIAISMQSFSWAELISEVFANQHYHMLATRRIAQEVYIVANALR